ncbi:putative polyketide synthase [Plenodomus tracheiphilus IPT5]|uniref:Polyketide synthase n=1 Tax=Plenodomus tracheiphilus IPT5 TaxID=1408161 RepID=A0A6A7AUP1_9PLEO|nr:putative polyketide synthase [Plenodomus tracheiphilus IPT5]
MPHREERSVEEDGGLEPVAIVGMACHLPGAIDSSSSLWEALKEKRSVQTPKVPDTRFNIDAYLHENLERPGSFNVPGGYFLDGPAEDFDPTFFGMTPIEAMWLDPQQRKMLEVTYECLESGGLTLDSVAGSNTAVFVGSFTSDYQQMSTKDGDFRHNYAATGVDTGIISARIGNTFNLNGPIFTINTACSSAIYAIHNACNALRARDCNAAIAGGVNLILTVDQHMNTAKLGILSPTSTCHTFDASADGYGRAEGAGALYLKRLSDAIRDGDPIRGVIRTSAVNTNGKVPGMGITHPSEKGQERVVRAAYARAGLDPLHTAYVECHGTGTPVGDPIESHAVARAMNDKRRADRPLIIGAIKANIGHSEAASGIFATMKAALMTESGIVPGVCGLKNLNPAIHEQDWNIRVARETEQWPTGFTARRAGVSSFGYGGTNGHVVIESVESLYPLYRHGHRRSEAPHDYLSTARSRPFLVGFSAHDRPTLERNITAHAAVAEEFYLADLAYTLLARRSRFSTRAFTVASEPHVAADFDLSAFTIGNAPRTAPSLGFIFTGQGAQWSGLGLDAMKAFPPFRSTIQALDRILQRLDHNRPQWTLESALSANSDAIDINDAEISQPVCTAVQIAIVDLFAQWGIFPAVTVGHSSGEIAAAYAAGLLSAPEAIVAAFLRGVAVKRYAPVGSMLAVGMGAKEAQARLLSFNSRLAVACQNSPVSTTLSGTPEAVAETKEQLQAEGIFARELPTGKAYHSSQMDNVAVAYDTLLSQAVDSLEDISLDWRRPRVSWFSSVTGTEYNGEYVPASYWSENLRSRVLFDEAVAALGRAPGLENVGVMIEIGPHAALSGPFRQICQGNKFEHLSYVPSLIRGKDSAVQLLKTAGALFNANYPIDPEEVNSIRDATAGMQTQKNRRPLLLVDLPPYQWNYERKFWTEPRLSHEQRHLTHPRHDLLGSKIVGLSENSLAWRNMLRHKDLPWLQDHRLGKEAVFPAAAHLSVACEALRQVCENKGIKVDSVTFRDVAIKVALVIPETDDGIEMQLNLNNIDDTWFNFTIETYYDDVWNLHCQGSIAANYREQKSLEQHSHPVDLAKLTQRVPGKRWYDAFNRVGFEYGPSFQPLGSIRTNRKHHSAAADVRLETESGLMTGESRYLLHPATIDGCLQLIIISINAGLHKEMQHGVVPIAIEELSIWPSEQTRGSAGHAVAWTDELDGRYFNTHTKLASTTGQVVLDVKSLRCVSYEAAVPQSSLTPKPREPYMETVWKPDVANLTTEQAIGAYPSIQSEQDSIAAVVELIQHKKHLSRALLVGQVDSKTLAVVLTKLTGATEVILADTSKEQLGSITAEIDLPSNLSIIATDGGLFAWGEQLIEPMDLVIIGKGWTEIATEEQLVQSLGSVLTENGRLIVSAPDTISKVVGKTLPLHGYTEPQLYFQLPDVSVIATIRVGHQSNGHASAQHKVTIFTHSDDSESPSALLSAYIEKSGFAVQRTDISHVLSMHPEAGERFIIHDVSGNLVSALDETTFKALKKILTSGVPTMWLTSGVNEGTNVTGGMSQGLLRTVRSENVSAKILLLDADVINTAEAVGDTVIGMLDHIQTKDSGADTEFWLHNGTLHVPRVLSNKSLNAAFASSSSPPVEKVLSGHDILKGSVVDGKLTFQHQDKEALKDNDIRLQVGMANLEKTDLQVRTNGPRIIAGKVTAVGASLDPKFVGKNAVAFAADPFSTSVTVPVSHAGFYVNSLDETQLVASLSSLTSAINAIVNVAQARAGERVLLLSAPLSYVTAVASLEKALDIHLTAVVAQDEIERQKHIAAGISSDSVLLASDMPSVLSLLDQQHGGEATPDIIISHDFGSLSREVWRFAPPGVRFVLNDASPQERPDALPFLRGASFLSTGLATLYKRQPGRLGSILNQALELFIKSPLKPQEPKPLDISELNDIGGISVKDNESVVLKYNYEQSLIQVQSRAKTIQFSSEAAYLLVGCLGGLGRSLTTLMMERGARHFAFLSRSGADKSEAASLVQSLERSGANVQIFRGDASREADVASAVSSITANRPILGVVHAAMVLQDGMFEGMTLDQFNAAIVPKMRGARSLHKVLKDTALDFFVMTSSISATMGNPGQANYSAANSYLDALAWHRNSQLSLPATSLILPMILDVGVVAENESIETALSHKAMYGIDEREMLRGFEIAMMKGASNNDATLGQSQIILGLEPAHLAAAIESAGASDDAYWLNDARFQGLRTVVEEIGQGSERAGTSSTGDLTAALKAAQTEGPDAVLATLAEHITQKLSSMLLIPASDFEFDGSSVAAYGLDSMIGADLRNWLFKQFTLEMSFQHLLAPKMTIRALATVVAEHLYTIA